MHFWIQESWKAFVEGCSSSKSLLDLLAPHNLKKEWDGNNVKIWKITWRIKTFDKKQFCVSLRSASICCNLLLFML